MDWLNVILKFAPTIIECIRNMDDNRAERLVAALESDHGKMTLDDLAAALSSDKADAGKMGGSE